MTTFALPTDTTKTCACGSHAVAVALEPQPKRDPRAKVAPTKDVAYCAGCWRRAHPRTPLPEPPTPGLLRLDPPPREESAAPVLAPTCPAAPPSPEEAAGLTSTLEIPVTTPRLRGAARLAALTRDPAPPAWRCCLMEGGVPCQLSVQGGHGSRGRPPLSTPGTGAAVPAGWVCAPHAQHLRGQGARLDQIPLAGAAQTQRHAASALVTMLTAALAEAGRPTPTSLGGAVADLVTCWRRDRGIAAELAGELARVRAVLDGEEDPPLEEVEIGVEVLELRETAAYRGAPPDAAGLYRALGEPEPGLECWPWPSMLERVDRVVARVATLERDNLLLREERDEAREERDDARAQRDTLIRERDAAHQELGADRDRCARELWCALGEPDGADSWEELIAYAEEVAPAHTRAALTPPPLSNPAEVTLERIRWLLNLDAGADVGTAVRDLYRDHAYARGWMGGA